MSTPGSQVREVCGLYRKCLRLAFDWVSHRDEHRRIVVAIRHQFDLHRNEQDPQQVALLRNATRYLLWKRRHPEPYICTTHKHQCLILDPTAPGGVAYDREPNFPKAV